MNMDLPNKIRKLSKDTNHMFKLNINDQIKELLIQEIKLKKNANNKKLNRIKLARKKMFTKYHDTCNSSKQSRHLKAKQT